MFVKKRQKPITDLINSSTTPQTILIPLFLPKGAFVVVIVW